jgi:hypothetical protein
MSGALEQVKPAAERVVLQDCEEMQQDRVSTPFAAHAGCPDPTSGALEQVKQAVVQALVCVCACIVIKGLTRTQHMPP